ncbi:MAG: epoxyqueuosine reductase [Desulfobacterales bacterium]|nr:epoxyqueuosine reductase [Desulfobacterales bacterium]
MNIFSSSDMSESIVEKAKSLGASVAGIADVESLKESPSHRICPKISLNLNVHLHDAKDYVKPDEVFWPADAVSAVVIGIAHNADEPELDWWDGRGTPGNRILMQINKKLSEWIENTFPVKTYQLPYFVEKGGIFLKDAAVIAGLGCIGKNNLVITPDYGPRIRFRTLLLDQEVKATDPLEFNPCEDCSQPCRKACPQKAFQNTVYSADTMGQSILPGINGTYDRVICNVKMQKDIEEAVMVIPAGKEEHQDIQLTINEFEEDIMVKPGRYKELYCVRYCRRCELSCPVGKQDGGVSD